MQQPPQSHFSTLLERVIPGKIGPAVDTAGFKGRRALERTPLREDVKFTILHTCFPYKQQNTHSLLQSLMISLWPGINPLLNPACEMESDATIV